jgi:hypothetical protein
MGIDDNKRVESEGALVSLTVPQARSLLLKKLSALVEFAQANNNVFYEAVVVGNAEGARIAYNEMLQLYRKFPEQAMQVLIQEVEREFPYLKINQAPE